MAQTKKLEGRLALLEQYIREVALELIQRGILDAQLGRDPVHILKKRPAEMFGAIVHDLKDAGFSIGNEIIGGLVSGVVGSLISRR